MFISMSNGQVLSIFDLDSRSIECIKKEVSQRVSNLCAPGKLLTKDLKVIASFNSFGKEV